MLCQGAHPAKNPHNSNPSGHARPTGPPKDVNPERSSGGTAPSVPVPTARLVALLAEILFHLANPLGGFRLGPREELPKVSCASASPPLAARHGHISASSRSSRTPSTSHTSRQCTPALADPAAPPPGSSTARPRRCRGARRRLSRASPQGGTERGSGPASSRARATSRPRAVLLHAVALLAHRVQATRAAEAILGASVVPSRATLTMSRSTPKPRTYAASMAHCDNG